MNNQLHSPYPWGREEMNVFLSSLAALITGIQILLIAVFIDGALPVTPHGSIAFLSEWSQLVKPERESLLYQIFVVSVIAVFIGSFYFLQKKIANFELNRSLKRFLIFEVFYAVVMGLALLNGRSSAEPSSIAKGSFFCALGISILGKVFWNKINTALQTFTRQPPLKNKGGVSSALCYLVVFIFIFLSVFVRDNEGVIAQIFMKDRFHHLEMFVASPAWAFVKGGILNIDHCSQYGIGMPVVVGSFSRMLGGASYTNILTVLMGMTIIYLSLCLFFLRVWLKSVALAVAGIFLILKFQIFSSAASDPIIWRYPSASPARYFFDVPFFILIFYHLKTGAARYLIAGGIVCGAATAYVTDTGLYLTVAFYGYLFLLFILPDARKQYFSLRPHGLNGIYAALPLCSLIFFFWLMTGPHVLTAVFWQNLSEVPRLVKAGWGAIPIGIFIEEGKYLNFIMAVFMCALYLLTVMNVAALCYRKKMGFENLLSVVIGIYGLGTLHYYITRSSPDSVSAVCIPFLLLICFWLKVLKEKLPKQAGRYVFPSVAVFAFCALLMTPAFRTYPHFWNLSKNAFAEEKQYLKDEYFSSKDVALITRLTSPLEKVCLISNMETSILMAADRRPFFYYFPLVLSRSFKMLDFGGTFLFTEERLNKTLFELETQKPRYIFVEKKFVKALPSVYYLRFQSLSTLLAYTFEHYRPESQGEHLVAMRRVN